MSNYTDQYSLKSASRVQHPDNRKEKNVYVVLKKSRNDRGEGIKAEERRCEISCLVVFLVDKRTGVLMMGGTFRVKGYSD